MSHVDLPDDGIRLAEALVSAGRADSIEDVVRAGIAALGRDQQLHDVGLAKLRTAIDEGDEGSDPFTEVRRRQSLPPVSR